VASTQTPTGLTAATLERKYWPCPVPLEPTSVGVVRSGVKAWGLVGDEAHRNRATCNPIEDAGTELRLSLALLAADNGTTRSSGVKLVFDVRRIPDRGDRRWAPARRGTVRARPSESPWQLS
jgi:hypothetical protein